MRSDRFARGGDLVLRLRAPSRGPTRRRPEREVVPIESIAFSRGAGLIGSARALYAKQMGVGVPVTERRQQQRFPLILPARLTTSRDRRPLVRDLRTRDVSSAGVFLETRDAFCVGSKVRVELFLSVNNVLEIIRTDDGARIAVRGRVIRSTHDGIAVQFSNGFSMRPMGRQG